LNLPKGRKVALGFQDAATKYLTRLPEEGGKDLVMKERRLRIHLVPFFGDIPLSNVKSFDVERYKKHRLKEEAKHGTINRELAALSHLFTKALEWGWLDKRPAVIKRFQEDSGRIIYLTAEQAERLIEASKGDQNPQVYPFIVIGLETSMRRTEILSIRKEHVNTERRVIYIPLAKAGAREQPMTARLAAFLSDYMQTLPDSTPWLFPSPKSRTGHTFDIRKAFRRVVAAAGLDPDIVVRHTLRHTAITHLVQAGVDLPTVQRISGHKTLSMVAKYSHQNGAHIQAAMDKLEARYTTKTG
jgi:integrase